MKMQSLRRLVSALVLGCAVSGAWATVDVSGVPLDETVTVGGVPLQPQWRGLPQARLLQDRRHRAVPAAEGHHARTRSRSAPGVKRVQLVDPAGRHRLAGLALLPDRLRSLGHAGRIRQADHRGLAGRRHLQLAAQDQEGRHRHDGLDPRQGPASRRSTAPSLTPHGATVALHEQRAAGRGDAAHVRRRQDAGRTARQPAGPVHQHARPPAGAGQSRSRPRRPPPPRRSPLRRPPRRRSPRPPRRCTAPPLHCQGPDAWERVGAFFGAFRPGSARSCSRRDPARTRCNDVPPLTGPGSRVTWPPAWRTLSHTAATSGTPSARWPNAVPISYSVTP